MPFSICYILSFFETHLYEISWDGSGPSTNVVLAGYDLGLVFDALMGVYSSSSVNLKICVMTDGLSVSLCIFCAVKVFEGVKFGLLGYYSKFKSVMSNCNILFPGTFTSSCFSTTLYVTFCYQD
jgi:hypothetical protein